jgi:DNA-binding NtrC family response regulator
MQSRAAMAKFDRANLALGSARILLVDDSAVTRAIVGRGLKLAGMVVDEARGGEEALQSLAAQHYDVVISDLYMPGFDGFALLASIKAQSPTTEVVILSGVQDVTRAMQALKLGAHAYLAKPPAHPEEVLLTVKRAHETKRLRELCIHLQQQLEEAEERAVPGRPGGRTGEPRARVAASG